MKRLFLVALALVAFLVVSPTSAYTELGHWTIGQGSQQQISWGLYLYNPNITKITIDNAWCSFYGLSPTFTPEDTLSLDIVDPVSLEKKGDAVLTWDYNEVPDINTWGYADFEITIEDFIGTSEYSYILALDGQTTNFVGALATYCYASANTGDPTNETTRGTLAYHSNYAWNYQLTPSGTTYVYGGSDITPPEASFTCTPTSQYPNADVVCTDTSTNTPTDWYWSIDAEAMGIEGWKTNTTQNFTWSSPYVGLYSVNLRVNNSAGNDWENKSNYVSISENATPNNCNIPPLAGLVRSWAQCVDSQTSGAVAGCDLSLYDLEGGAWSNVTDRFDGTWCIDTYPGHHFHAYGSAENYTPDPTYRLNLPVSSSIVYELLMHPGYIPAAADGKVWLYVIVNDADTGASLADAHVSISGSGQTTKSDVTDNTGSVHIQWANVSTAYVTASKAGYTSGSKTVITSDFGPDTVRIELHRSTVTPTATATTGPGGTVPTTAGPWGTPGPYGTMPSGYTNAQGQMAMDFLAANGLMLVQLCVFVTVAALLGFKFGK